MSGEKWRLDLDKPNILLITIDSLRPDHLGTFGYGRETSPNIDELANRGRNFTMAFTHGGGTPQAFPPILAGVPPPVDVQQCNLRSKKGVKIVHLLKGLGYETGAFNSNPFLSSYYGYSDGFDQFFHDLKGAVDDRHTFAGGGIMPYLRLVFARPPYVIGEDLTQIALSWISRTKRPFFTWIHYMDVHMPYLPPTDSVRAIEHKPCSRYYMVWLYRKMYKSNKRVYRTMDPSLSNLTNRDLANIVNYYDGAIRYVDSCVGALLQGLESQRKLQNTLIILTADHGELLGEHGVVDHGYLYDQDIHVPLIFAGSNISNARVDTPVTHLAIQKTIMDILKVDESYSSNELARGFADFNQGIISTVVDVRRKSYSCRTMDWHYIETSDSVLNTNVFELYNLKDDPSEEENVAADHLDLVTRFHSRIDDFVSNNRSVGEIPGPRLISKNEEQELRRKFRELGYE